MSAWSGSVAECPYTRITKSWPTFSSRLIREMSRAQPVRSVEAVVDGRRRAGRGAGEAGRTPVAAAAVACGGGGEEGAS